MELNKVTVSRDGKKYHPVYNGYNHEHAEKMFLYFSSDIHYNVKWYKSTRLYSEHYTLLGM